MEDYYYIIKSPRGMYYVDTISSHIIFKERAQSRAWDLFFNEHFYWFQKLFWAYGCRDYYMKMGYSCEKVILKEIKEAA
jgi:hypothetical protein